MNLSRIEDLIEGSRAWSVSNVREFPEKAHEVMNEMANQLADLTSHDSGASA